MPHCAGHVPHRAEGVGEGDGGDVLLPGQRGGFGGRAGRRQDLDLGQAAQRERRLACARGAAAIVIHGWSPANTHRMWLVGAPSCPQRR